MVSLAEVKEPSTSPDEVDKVISDAIGETEAAAEKIEDTLKEKAAINLGDDEKASPAAAADEKAQQEEEDDDEEEEDEDDDEDSDSDYEDDFDPNETFQERIEALKDILTPEQRSAIVNAVSSTKSGLITLASKTGTALWYLTTTTLLLGAPLALSIIHETQLTELEKEMNLQQSSQDILTPDSEKK